VGGEGRWREEAKRKKKKNKKIKNKNLMWNATSGVGIWVQV
jgi:hypothetical protein